MEMMTLKKVCQVVYIAEGGNGHSLNLCICAFITEHESQDGGAHGIDLNQIDSSVLGE